MSNYKITLKNCQEYAKTKSGKCLSVNYHYRQKLEWECEFGHKWLALFNNTKRDHWCKLCSLAENGNRCRKTLEKYTKDLYSVHGSRIVLLEDQDYKNSQTKLLHKCNKCTGIFDATPANMLKRGCPYCAGKRVLIGFNSLIDTYPDIAKQWHPTKNKNGPENYTAKSNKIFWWICEKSHEWRSSINNRTSGKGCPFCSKVISKPQTEICTYLCSIFPELNIILNDKEAIYPFDLDIHIPFLNKAIEYDGEYWHYSDWAIRNGSLERMAEKDQICIEKNIQLLRIREIEWLEDRELVCQQIIDFIDL